VARPTVHVLNAQEVGIETLPAIGKDDVWDGEIQVQVANGSDPRNRPLAPEVRFLMPDEENLCGKELQIQVDMDLTYAAMSDEEHYVDITIPISSHFEVRVAPPGSMQGLRRAFLVGMIGAPLSVVGGLALGLTSLRWKRRSSQILLPDAESLCR
jgi:hypothetical protein